MESIVNSSVNYQINKYENFFEKSYTITNKKKRGQVEINMEDIDELIEFLFATKRIMKNN